MKYRLITLIALSVAVLSGAQAGAEESAEKLIGLKTPVNGFEDYKGLALAEIESDIFGDEGLVVSQVNFEGLEELPVKQVQQPQMSSNGQITIMPLLAVKLSDRCEMVVAESPGKSTKRYIADIKTQVKTVKTVRDQSHLRLTISMKMLDAEDPGQAPETVSCRYTVSEDEVYERNLEVLSLDYLVEKGMLPKDYFQFKVDAKELALLKSVSA